MVGKKERKSQVCEFSPAPLRCRSKVIAVKGVICLVQKIKTSLEVIIARKCRICLNSDLTGGDWPINKYVFHNTYMRPNVAILYTQSQFKR